MHDRSQLENPPLDFQAEIDFEANRIKSGRGPFLPPEDDRALTIRYTCATDRSLLDQGLQTGRHLPSIEQLRKTITQTCSSGEEKNEMKNFHSQI